MTINAETARANSERFAQQKLKQQEELEKATQKEYETLLQQPNVANRINEILQKIVEISTTSQMNYYFLPKEWFEEPQKLSKKEWDAVYHHLKEEKKFWLTFDYDKPCVRW